MGGDSGSRPADGTSFPPSGFDPGREEVAWALQTVRNMVDLGIIEDTIAAKTKHFTAIMDAIAPTTQQSQRNEQ